jgi:hypothetical protein
MKSVNLYRALLKLYPADFRTQFSEEMVSVFEQRPAGNLTKELLGLVKGAHTMWLSRVLPIHDNPSSETEITTQAPATVAEITTRRRAAIQDMCASIARHDFRSARRYSDEECRLQHLLSESEH